MISVKSLNIGDTSIEELKKAALFDSNVTLIIGKGIESVDVDTEQLQNDIIKINRCKKQLQADRKSEQEVETFLRNYMSKESMQRILKSPLIRYDYMASNYTIDGVVIGDFKVRVSFDLGKANLIGMHIIKELYTKIFSERGKICLFATKNPEHADKELDAFRQQLELIDK